LEIVKFNQDFEINGDDTVYTWFVICVSMITYQLSYEELTDDERQSLVTKINELTEHFNQLTAHGKTNDKNEEL